MIMEMVASLYISLMPVILAGALNMWFCKQPLGDSFKKPIDQGRLGRDGKPLFGGNKTWKGFVGMILSGSFCQVVWAIVLAKFPSLQALNIFYQNHPSSFIYNVGVGACLGFAYIICELPNSYLKRRFDVVPGKQATQKGRFFFFLLDQIDSLFGCVLVVVWLTPASWIYALGLIVLGGLTHIGVNQVLYRLNWRQNPF